jgi:hypothetical protein
MSGNWYEWANYVITQITYNKRELDKLQYVIRKIALDIATINADKVCDEKDKKRIEEKLKELELSFDRLDDFRVKITTIVAISTGILTVLIAVLTKVIF